MNNFDLQFATRESMVLFWTFVGVAVVSSIVLATSAVLRHHASLRHAVLLAGLLSCLSIPFVVAFAAFNGPIVELPLLPSPNVVAQEIPSSAPVSFRPAHVSQVVDTGGSKENVTRAGTNVSQGSAQSNLIGPRPSRSWSTGRFIAFGWGTVSCVLMLFALRSMYRVRLVRRRAQSLQNERVASAADIAAQATGLRSIPTLLESDDVATPAVVGLARPSVLIPVDLQTQLNDKDLTDVLIHEFAHVARRDTWIVLLQAAAKCLLWPVPTLHVLNNQLALAREEVCDNFVLVKRSRVGYSEMLLRLAQLSEHPRPLVAGLGMLPRPGQLKTRVTRILDQSRQLNTRTPLYCSLGLVGLLVSATVLFYSTKLVAAPAPPLEEQPIANESTREETRDTEIEALSAASERPNGKVSIDVHGVVRDASGKPVAGAKVQLAAVNDRNKLLATTHTDDGGGYEFQDIVSPGRTVDVFAIADKYGLAWHGMRFIYPDSERPETEPRGSDRDKSFYKGEQIEMDLTLSAAGRLHGRIVDEKDRPVRDATVEVNSIDYLHIAGRTRHANFREFWGLQFVPSSITKATTDDAGNFEFSHLPVASIAWLSVSHKRYANQHLYAAVLDPDSGRSEYDINAGKLASSPNRDRSEDLHVSPLQISVAATNTLAVRIVNAKNEPVPGIPVHAGSGGRATGTHASGTTDARGQANLALPPGEYSVLARAPRDSEYVSVMGRATLTKEEPSAVCEIQIESGCKLILTAIDADTRKPIVGVSFWEEKFDGRSGYRELERHPSWIAHDCRTNEKGEATAIVRPGTRKYGIGFIQYPPPYSGSGATGLEIECLAGETVRATLELHTPTAEENMEFLKAQQASLRGE